MSSVVNISAIRRAAKKAINNGCKGDYLSTLSVVEEKAIFGNDRKGLKVIEDCREAVKTNTIERIYDSFGVTERQKSNQMQLLKNIKPLPRRA